MYDHYFSKFGRPPVSDDICKDSAIRNPQFWRTRFLKVFPIQMHREANLTLQRFSPKASSVWRRFLKVLTIYGHGGHLGQ